MFWLTLKYSPSTVLSLLTLFQSACRLIEFSGTCGNVTTPTSLIAESALSSGGAVFTVSALVDTMFILVVGLVSWELSLGKHSLLVDWTGVASVLVGAVFDAELALESITSMIGVLAVVAIGVWSGEWSGVWGVVGGAAVVLATSSPMSSMSIRLGGSYWSEGRSNHIDLFSGSSIITV